MQGYAALNIYTTPFPPPPQTMESLGSCTNCIDDWKVGLRIKGNHSIQKGSRMLWARGKDHGRQAQYIKRVSQEKKREIGSCGSDIRPYEYLISPIEISVIFNQ